MVTLKPYVRKKIPSLDLRLFSYKRHFHRHKHRYDWGHPKLVGRRSQMPPLHPQGTVQPGLVYSNGDVQGRKDDLLHRVPRKL